MRDETPDYEKVLNIEFKKYGVKVLCHYVPSVDRRRLVVELTSRDPISPMLEQEATYAVLHWIAETLGVDDELKQQKNEEWS